MSAVLMLHKNMIIITDYELDYNHEEGVFTLGQEKRYPALFAAGS